MVDQLEDYVLPRLMTDRGAAAHRRRRLDRRRQVDAGELAGRHAGSPSPACCGRPPARRCWCTTPTTRDWFGQDRILPDLERTDRADRRPRRAAAGRRRRRCRQGLAILDAPDIDSVEERNRTLAAQLLAAADLWLFVTSAARYADQVPWDFLKPGRRAQSTAVAIVLDRTPPDAVDEVSRPPGPDARRAAASRTRRCSPSPRARSTTTGCCPPTTVAEIRGWLDALAADADARAAVVKQTLDGAVRTARRGAPTTSPTPRPSRSTP